MFADASFATPGLHHVRVRMTDGLGLTGVAVLPVDVRADQEPSVSLTLPPIARVGAPATLRASAADPERDPVTLTWDTDGDSQFDDGTGTSLAFTPGAAGVLELAVKGDDGHGAMQVARATLTATADPAVAPVVSDLTMSPAVLRAGRTAQLYATGRTADGMPAALSFELDGDGAFDDVPTSDGFNRFSFTVPAARTTIAVKASDGARSAVRTIDIEPREGNLAPRVWLDPNYSAPFPTPGLAYYGAEWEDIDGSVCCPPTGWDTDGDGEYDDAQPGLYTKAGDYALGVEAADGDGGTATAVRTFSLGGKPPKAAFSLAGGLLTSTATDPDGDAIAAAEWDLDGDRAFDDAAGGSVRALAVADRALLGELPDRGRGRARHARARARHGPGRPRDGQVLDHGTPPARAHARAPADAEDHRPRRGDGHDDADDQALILLHSILLARGAARQ